MFRVKISFAEEPQITSTTTMILKDFSGKKIREYEKGTKVTLKKKGDEYIAYTNSEGSETSRNFLKLEAKDNGILTIENFSRRAAWNNSYNDNKFRGILEFRIIDGNNVVINELPLEYYLKGLAEETNTTPPEKIKAITVAARSYAKFYMHYADKFPGKPYHLEDDPATSQKYMGYGYEERAPNIVKAVDATKGEVVTHQGQLVKAPYFTSDEGMTKSASEVWKWNAPYLQAVEDPYCVGKTQAGHGVGMSGCGALAMAQNGKTYKEILKYYYSGIEITKLW